MSFKEKLSKYAQLIVKAGLNVQPAQIVVIDAPVESVELVRLVTKEAYAAGAREVVVKYNDEVVSRYKYKYLEKKRLLMFQRGLKNLEMIMLLKRLPF